KLFMINRTSLLYLVLSTLPAMLSAQPAEPDLITVDPARVPDESTTDSAQTTQVDTAALVDAECRRIGGKLGSVSYRDCSGLNLEWTRSTSVRQAPILLKEYPPLAQRTPLGKVLLIGGIHGDEYSSVSIVFKWMQTLEQHHSGLFHWRIVPLLNPD